MRQPLLKYLFIFLCTASVVPGTYAQVADTIEASLAGKIAKSDELYFAAIKARMHDDDRQATELLEKFIIERPDVSAAYYDLSMLNYRDKNADKAEQYIKKAIALDADNKWYQEQYASILSDRGAYLEAAKIMADLSVSEPYDPSYLIAASENYEHGHKYEEALKYLDKAIEANGPDEDLLERKMQLYLSLNNVDKAANVVKELIAQDPKNGKYYKLLGELYDNNKMPEKATEVYTQAQKAVPGDPSIQLGIAEHYLKIGDSASYVAYVKKVILNSELDAPVQLELLTSFIKGLPSDSMAREQGLPLTVQLVAQHPADPEVLAFYGDFLEILSEHDSASTQYKKALAIKPGNFNVWGSLLGSYVEPKDADSLIKYSEKAMHLFPNQALVHFYNGIGHLNKKNIRQLSKP